MGMTSDVCQRRDKPELSHTGKRGETVTARVGSQDEERDVDSRPAGLPSRRANGPLAGGLTDGGLHVRSNGEASLGS